ncbi:MAG: hypothetical protein Q7S77_01080, partial [Candidatus Staskawiczbacteria bacterium]|nr:hypothetical protein [Candidatus Staskawiczbacteria bacterium]
MKLKNLSLLHVTIVFSAFLAVGFVFPSIVNAACGTTALLSQPSNFYPGLTIVGVANTVSGATNTLFFNVTNNESKTKTLLIEKGSCRCQQHLGLPFRTGVGQCQYYWSGEPVTSTACRVISEQMSLGSHETKTIQASVSQYQNATCGSFQLDLRIDKIDGVSTSTIFPFGASFTDMCNDCSNTIICSTNSQCGTNGYIDGPYCQGNSVYQNYKTYTCNNPGTANSSCSQAVTSQ